MNETEQLNKDAENLKLDLENVTDIITNAEKVDGTNPDIITEVEKLADDINTTNIKPSGDIAETMQLNSENLKSANPEDTQQSNENPVATLEPSTNGIEAGESSNENAEQPNDCDVTEAIQLSPENLNSVNQETIQPNSENHVSPEFAEVVEPSANNDADVTEQLTIETPESEWSELKFLGQWKKVECDDFKKGIK